MHTREVQNTSLNHRTRWQCECVKTFQSHSERLLTFFLRPGIPKKGLVTMWSSPWHCWLAFVLKVWSDNTKIRNLKSVKLRTRHFYELEIFCEAWNDPGKSIFNLTNFTGVTACERIKIHFWFSFYDFSRTDLMHFWVLPLLLKGSLTEIWKKRH